MCLFRQLCLAEKGLPGKVRKHIEESRESLVSAWGNKGSECLIRFLIPLADTPCSSGYRHTPIASPAVVSYAPSPLERVHSQWPPLFPSLRVSR